MRFLRLLFTIALIFVFAYTYGQEVRGTCNCLKTPVECIPEISRRKIVSNDTLLAHHSYCYEIVSADENKRIVVLTRLCSEKPRDSFLLSFFDSSTLGDRVETWYDTSGRFIYNSFSKNKVVKECYWYHYSANQKNYDYTIGYRDGELFKEIYTWDEYDASYIKKIIITRKQIRTEVRTDKTDAYGYIVWKSSTKLNKSGKVE